MEIEDNMKMFFEDKISSIDINVDVEKAVMSKIASPKRITYNKRILATIVIISMCMASTGIVYGQEIIMYIKNMDFMNNRGEVEWTITTDEEDYGDYSVHAMEVFENLDIEDGKAVAIYVTDNNPQNIIVSMQKPLTVQEIDVINSYKIGSLNVALEKVILDKYYFKTGEVTFDMASYIDQDGMIQEASETGNNVIINDIEVTDRVRATSYNYYNDSSSTDEKPYFTINIMKWDGNKLIKSNSQDDNLTDYASVMIGDSEVLYENSNDTKQIKWISEECYFNIVTTQEDMSMEELLKIAEQIKIK